MKKHLQTLISSFLIEEKVNKENSSSFETEETRISKMVLDQDIKEYTTFDNALKVRVVFIITNCFF